jgi:hypothetical protein
VNGYYYNPWIGAFVAVGVRWDRSYRSRDIEDRRGETFQPARSFFDRIKSATTTTVGEEMKEALIREGFAFYMALRDQIMESTPDYKSLVFRPSKSDAVRSWWQTTANAVYGEFSAEVQSVRRGWPLSAHELITWAKRLSQLRREAAQLRLSVPPSVFFDAVDEAQAAVRY